MRITSIRDLSIGLDYKLEGEEFSHWELFKKADGGIGRRPVFTYASWASRAIYIGRAVSECRCAACHRRIKWGYCFMGETDRAFVFGRTCLKNHTRPEPLTEEVKG